MIKIAGAGWIYKNNYGCLSRGSAGEIDSIGALAGRLIKEAIINDPIKDFGRFDKASKLSCCAVALAKYDAENRLNDNDVLDTGIIITGSEGCLRSNKKYYKDYVRNGKRLSRGNLFLYTLPSTPAAEAAIYSGLRGPVMYMHYPDGGIKDLVADAGRMIQNREASSMIVVRTDEDSSVSVVVVGETIDKDMLDIDEVLRRLENNCPPKADPPTAQWRTSCKVQS